MKIVINCCYGGFSLSEAAIALYNKLSGKEEKYYSDIERNDKYLVKVVEQLGWGANGKYSELKIVEIPEGTNWYIQEYDGIETIAEGRQWY